MYFLFLATGDVVNLKGKSRTLGGFAGGIAGVMMIVSPTCSYLNQFPLS